MGTLNGGPVTTVWASVVFLCDWEFGDPTPSLRLYLPRYNLVAYQKEYGESSMAIDDHDGGHDCL